MKFLHRISLPAHGLVELLGGLALLAAPFVFDLGLAGTILTFAAGVLVFGLGLAASDAISLGVHRSLDRMVAIVLSFAAVGAAVAGDDLAATVLLAAAATQLLLTTVTRWTRAAIHA